MRIAALSSVYVTATLVVWCEVLCADASPKEKRALFPSEVSMVAVDVVASDDDGNPVRGLSRDDFILTEDGRPQTVVTFDAVEAGDSVVDVGEEPPFVSTNVTATKSPGRIFVIVFDGVHLTPGGAERAKKSIARFLREDVRDGDVVSLISTAGEQWQAVVTSRGRDRLIRALDELRGERIDMMPPGVYISDFEAMRIVEHEDWIIAGKVYKRLVQSGAVVDPTSGYPASSQSTSTGVSGSYAFHPEVVSYAQQMYDFVQKRRRGVLKTLARVLDSLETKRARKCLLLVSEGFVADSQTTGIREAVDAARRANTALYFLDARGLGADLDIPTTSAGPFAGANVAEMTDMAHAEFDADAESGGASLLADETGGFSIKRANDLAGGFARINRESTVYYLLGYRSTNQNHDGAYRRIGVELNRKGVKVRARRGYYAPGRDSRARSKHGDEVAVAMLQQAVDAPFQIETVPLRASAYVLYETEDGKASVVVAADVNIDDFVFERQGDRFYARMDFLVVVHDLESGDHFKSHDNIEMHLTQKSREVYARTWYPVLRDFQLASGRYQAKVIALDTRGRLMGSVVHEFMVPELTGWRVTTPVLSDTLDSFEKGGVPRPVPLARRAFSPHGRLYCRFVVYGAALDKITGAPEVHAGFALMTSSGIEVLRGDPAVIRPDAQGRLIRLMGIPMEDLKAGEYVLALNFDDHVANVTHTLRETLTIVAAEDP